MTRDATAATPERGAHLVARPLHATTPESEREAMIALTAHAYRCGRQRPAA
jgi:hypothetical protein